MGRLRAHTVRTHNTNDNCLFGMLTVFVNISLLVKLQLHTIVITSELLKLLD
jgi:hypothetical protein